MSKRQRDSERVSVGNIGGLVQSKRRFKNKVHQGIKLLIWGVIAYVGYRVLIKKK